MPFDEHLPAQNTIRLPRLQDPCIRFPLRPVAHAMSAVIFGIALNFAYSPPVWAQSAGIQGRPAGLQSYSIPAGPLAPALRSLASSANLLLTFTESQTAGKTTDGVTGQHTPQSALAALLSGTGLKAAPLDNSGFVLRLAPALREAAPQAASDEAALRTVTVTAEAERGGPTEGTGSFTTGGTRAATGMNLSLRETPQSITVVTRERMDEQNLGTLAEVAEQVPGLFFVGHGTPVGGRSSLMSRGFMINSYQVDGDLVPWESMGEADRYSHASLDTAIYDSIAVVRGATGLLTGAGDPSGIVSLTRKKPTSDFQGSVTGSVGSWDRRRLVADIGGPLNAAGSLRGRLVGAIDKGKSWVDRYSDDRSTMYGVLEADIAPQTLLTLSLEHANSSSEGTYWHEESGPPLFFADGVTPIRVGRNASMAPPWTYTDSTRTRVSAAIDHTFSPDWSARLSYGYSTFSIDSRRAMVFEVPGDGTPTNTRLLVTDQQNHVHFANAKIDGKYSLFGRKHDLTGGINLSYTDQDFPFSHISSRGQGQAWWRDGQMHYDVPNWNALSNVPYESSTDQQGAYLATRLRPTDALSVILGGRLTNWKTFSADLDPYEVWDDRSYESEFTPYAGVVFDLTRSLSAYASYTEIFKPAWDKDVNGRLLDPEAGQNQELGLKGEWLGGRLNASLAVFETRKDNLAVADGDNVTPDGDQAFRAESDTQGRGWEFEVAGELSRGWQIQGGYSQFKIRDNEGAPLNTGNPVHQFKLYTSYRPAAMPRLTVGGGVRWQSKTYADWVSVAERPAYTIDAHAVVNLSARYELTDRVNLSVNFNNVLDKVYRTGTSTHSYGAPRNVTATLKYKF
jgi:outer membrane receptor for ferric coprogen and ferric-rhodotorulic acid